MKEMNDMELDRALSLVHAGDPPVGLTERTVRKALSFAQKKSMAAQFRMLLAELTGDVFGHSDDIPLYNVRWRAAGVIAALILGFSAGYYAPRTADRQDGASGLYAFGESEEMDAI